MKADTATLDLLFNTARTRNGWMDKSVGVEILHEIWNLTRMGPTSANCSPARIVFVTSKKAKEKLCPALLEANVAKAMKAPVSAIIGYDIKFYERLPQLFPHTDAMSWFVGNEELIQTTAFRNGTLQGAYFMMAARALGLDCGPISGFDNAMVDAIFFPNSAIKSNFICSIGYGNDENLYPRSPRLNFDEACRID
ncbi:MAG: malonic semialdehyde reductase [Magnetovibrio sp.]|nr:malonic semialdehyde reductase [Magnetovibrio sp.]|tara:strand:- start:461 stop:1045 length:585 start_codon:yes stop_codon:yes gene_type:complete